MACSVIFNKNKTPKGVLNQDGKPSKLFDKILSNPHISSFEKALDIYLQVDQEGELQYTSPSGETFTSFKEALLNSTGEIKAQVDGKTLFTIDTSVDESTVNGNINSLIKEGMLTGESILDNKGRKVFKVSGNESIRKSINSEIVRDSLKRNLGVKAVSFFPSGDFVINENKLRKNVTLTNKKGEGEVVDREEILKEPFQKVVNKFDEGLALFTARAYKEDITTFGSPIEKELEIVPENELQRKLLNLLKSFGIKTLSIADYVTKYSIKNGVDPSAEALADLANSVVAFKDGVITTENLSEEVAHFIVASLSEEQKADMKRNIHKTQQWLKYANTYFEIYSKTYQGEQLDDAVREEILGKVLAESITQNFSTENSKTASETSIISRLADLFNEFIERIRSYFTEQHQRDLNNFTSVVYRNLMNETLELDSSNIGQKGYTLYSTSSSLNATLDAMESKLKSLLQTLSTQSNQLSKRMNVQGDKSALNKVATELEGKLDLASAELAMLNLTKIGLSQVNSLSKVLDKNEKGKFHFSQEEQAVYNNLKTKTLPILNQILSKLTKGDSQFFNKDKAVGREIFKQIENTILAFSALEGRVPDNNVAAIERLVEKQIRKHELTTEQADKYRAEMVAIMTEAQKDTTWLHAHIGSLLHARNGLLNLAGDVIEKVQVDVRRDYLPLIKNMLNKLEAIGFPAEKLNRLINKGKIINEKDDDLVKKVDREDKAKAFNKVLNTNQYNESNIEEYINNLQKDTATEQDASILREGLLEFSKIKSLRYVSYFSEQYKEELDNASIVTDRGVLSRDIIPEWVLELNQFYKSQAGQIRKNAEDGELTEQDNIELLKLQRQKYQEVNPRNIDGTFKRGLGEYFDNTLNRWVLTLNINGLSDVEAREAQKVYFLNTLSLIEQDFYQKKFGDKGQASKFFERLSELKTEKEKWDFIKNNSTITFSDEFWQNFKVDESLVSRLQEQGADDLVDNIRRQQSIINSILRNNKEFNEPSEISVDTEYGISETEKKYVRDAVSELQLLFREANVVLGERVEFEENLEIQTVTNKAYKKDFEDSGKNEIDFIIDNTTSDGRRRISDLQNIANELKNGNIIELKGLASKVFSSQMTNEEIDEALLRFAKSRLLPYYKRTEPTGYSQVLETLENGVENEIEGSVENYINNPLVKVSPNFIFFETSANNINPEWQANKDAGREQYTKEYLDRVKNKEYFDTFAFDSNGNPTKNLDLWKAREAYLEFIDAGIELLGMTGVQDRYQLPQMHKDNLRRITASKNKKKALKEIALDMVGVREDDMDYGQDINGQTAKKGSTLLVVPTYGVRKLDSQEDVSDELLLSASWFVQQASLHKARKENIGDMFAIQDVLLREDAVDGKEAHSSMAYKMFKSYLDANFYGIKDTFSWEVGFGNKKIDVGKLARVFNKWVRFTNLAGITVPITSMFQGKVQEFLERQVGEIVDPIAYNEAHSYFKKHGFEASKEIMNLNSKSELNVYGEWIGAYNTSDRYEHSGYSKGARLATKAINGLHSLGNFPVVPTTFMGVIFDYRWVGNTVMSREQYKRNFPDATDSEWKSFELFKNQLNVKDGVVTPDKTEIEKRTGLKDEALDEWINTKVETISVRALDAIQRIDSQIPEHQKSIAARDARANFLLMHMNWFLNAIQTKTKQKHFNLSTGMYQEGNWATISRLLKETLLNAKDLKKVKEIWAESKTDPTTRKNLKRTAYELAIANALAVASLLLAGMNDDDDEVPFLLAYSDYILTRVANEQVSGTIGLPNQFGNLLTDPIVAVPRAVDLLKVWELGSSETIDRGSYAGMSERVRYLYKNAPLLKDYKRLKDPIQARQTYQYFNLEKDDNFDRYAWLTWIIVEEE